MFDNFSKVYVSVEDLAVRIMHVDPDRLLFMFDERILIFLKSDSFYLPSVKTPKMAANPLKKTEIRRYTTEVPAFRPFFQRYGWTLCVCAPFSFCRIVGNPLSSRYFYALPYILAISYIAQKKGFRALTASWGGGGVPHAPPPL